jgi:hypothetical protein
VEQCLVPLFKFNCLNRASGKNIFGITLGHDTKRVIPSRTDIVSKTPWPKKLVSTT